MVEFEREQYSKAVEILEPIRYKIVEMGGSNAQRDLFNQLLIVASIKSPVDCHRKLAHALLNERSEFKESGIANRLLTKIA
ncbi:tetratricopeptide repeat protein 38-like protein [Leptotrombidium deliense]|uniref:Tetratricopeptide repeat protein 38-like protein n=1 Tax=Leptotrombidium deliense TaxID=299467 RepID=A0A443RVY0_9ACAR|nr:tetratricopeptide repeat protein 38-like protein [Leptotrombidium deliense]